MYKCALTSMLYHYGRYNTYKTLASTARKEQNKGKAAKAEHNALHHFRKYEEQKRTVESGLPS